MFERFTDSARAVVLGARQQSDEMGNTYVGTEHLLLSMLDPASGIPHTVLTDVGLTADVVREAVREYLRVHSQGLGPADAEALEAIGINLDAVRAKLEETFGPGALHLGPPPPKRGLFRRRHHHAEGPPQLGRFTHRSRKVLELSLREALRLHQKEIRSEHILLGLLREGQGLAALVMTQRGIDLADVRQRTLSLAA